MPYNCKLFVLRIVTWSNNWLLNIIKKLDTLIKEIKIKEASMNWYKIFPYVVGGWFYGIATL